MNITSELREWAKALTHWWYDPVKDQYTYTTTDTMPSSIDAIRLDSSILAIADLIDAEHQKAMSRAGQLLADAEKDRDYNYANWQECKQKVLQGNITFDELNAKIEHLMDELSHCIELPKDADGEVIHVGDVLDGYGKTIEVVELRHGRSGWVLISRDGNGYADTFAFTHHAPTVEDVLREFAYGLGVPVADSYIAASAAKLRLAEGEDA